MKNMIFGAIALAIAVPAYAQTPPAEPKADCCEKMKAEGKDCCCKDMADKSHGERGMHDPKAGTDAAHQGHEGHAQ